MTLLFSLRLCKGLGMSGLPGAFLAAVFSHALSLTSGGYNFIANCLWNRLLEVRLSMILMVL